MVLKNKQIFFGLVGMVALLLIFRDGFVTENYDASLIQRSNNTNVNATTPTDYKEITFTDKRNPIGVRLNNDIITCAKDPNLSSGCDWSGNKGGPNVIDGATCTPLEESTETHWCSTAKKVLRNLNSDNTNTTDDKPPAWAHNEDGTIKDGFTCPEIHGFGGCANVSGFCKVSCKDVNSSALATEVESSTPGVLPCADLKKATGGCDLLRKFDQISCLTSCPIGGNSTQPSPPVAPSGDKPPTWSTSDLTCPQMKANGGCEQAWMSGHCLESCPPSSGASNVPAPAPPAVVAANTAASEATANATAATVAALEAATAALTDSSAETQQRAEDAAREAEIRTEIAEEKRLEAETAVNGVIGTKEKDNTPMIIALAVGGGLVFLLLLVVVLTKKSDIGRMGRAPRFSMPRMPRRQLPSPQQMGLQPLY